MFERQSADITVPSDDNHDETASLLVNAVMVSYGQTFLASSPPH